MSSNQHPKQLVHHFWSRPVSHDRPREPRPLFEKDERVLLREYTDDGMECLATDRALHWRADDADQRWSSARWSSMSEPAWDRATHILHLSTPGCSVSLHLPGHPRLPAFAVERTGQAHVLRAHISAGPSCSGSVDAVREGSSGTVIWTIHYDPGCDSNDPATQRTMSDAVRGIRRQAGC